MLKIYLGEMEEAYYCPEVYFQYNYEDEWITDPLSVEIIKDIDKCEVISAGCIKGPRLGYTSPERLCGGTKTLILINNEPDKVFSLTHCGDNCAKWLLKIAENKDVVVNLQFIMDFGWDNNFEIEILNTNQIVHNMEEFLNVYSTVER